ncbi:HIT domain-containing protein [Lachnospiraceae bacterium OttesenSCG-928-E19]|nr:HIT domain-containing protein [Lachnospiraceae bacterium OttesenSCG-928-E19]
MYDKNNIFAKILRGEIPPNKVYENEYAMSFHDVNPMFDTHVLIIPRGEYVNALEFSANASDDEQLGFWKCFSKTVEALGIKDDCNIVSNIGKNAPFASQSVPHYHLHLVAGAARPEFYAEVKSKHFN